MSGGLQPASPLSLAFTAYQNNLSKHPLRTKSLTSACVAGLSDAIAQVIHARVSHSTCNDQRLSVFSGSSCVGHMIDTHTHTHTHARTHTHTHTETQTHTHTHTHTHTTTQHTHTHTYTHMHTHTYTHTYTHIHTHTHTYTHTRATARENGSQRERLPSCFTACSGEGQADTTGKNSWKLCSRARYGSTHWALTNYFAMPLLVMSTAMPEMLFSSFYLFVKLINNNHHNNQSTPQSAVHTHKPQ